MSVKPEDAQAQAEDDQALVYVAKYLLSRGAATRDPRIVKLAQDAVEALKQSSGVEALLFMLPDPDETVPDPFMPPQRRRR